MMAFAIKRKGWTIQLSLSREGLNLQIDRGLKKGLSKLLNNRGSRRSKEVDPNKDEGENHLWGRHEPDGRINVKWNERGGRVT